jgi:hypothetical protein
VTNYILIFSDNKGNERFFLRRPGTAADVQRWLGSSDIWVGDSMPWASLKWEDML